MPGKRKTHFRLKTRHLRNVEKLVSLKDYAASQHVDESTIRYWIATHRLVAYKIRRRWWIDPESKDREPLYWQGGALFGI